MTAPHLLVGVGDERYALGVQDVLEVAELGEMTPVPGAPHALIGVQNLRGQVVPVVDLGALVGVSRAARRPTVVIVHDDGDPAGLAVDALFDVAPVAFAPDGQVELPLLASAMVDGALVGVLDIGAAMRLARESG